MTDTVEPNFDNLYDDFLHDDDRVLKTASGKDALYWKIETINQATRILCGCVRWSRTISRDTPEATVGIHTLYADDESVDAVISGIEADVLQVLYKALGCTQ